MEECAQKKKRVGQKKPKKVLTGAGIVRDASLAGPCFRLHTPLIEPEVRICRIRLSEKVSRGRSRETTRPRGEADEAQHGVQEEFRELPNPRSEHFVFST